MIVFQDHWTIATAMPLVVCSVIAVTLIVERVVFIYRQKQLSPKQRKDIFSYLDNDDIDKVEALITLRTPFFTSCFNLLIKHRNKDKEFRNEVVCIELNRVTRQLRKRLSAIVTIASLAPMLGLLGTIIGLMRSFHDIGLTVGPVEPAIVADGLWQALTTTAAGMTIAVVCVFFNALLSSRVRHLISEAGDLLSRHSLQLDHDGHARVGNLD
jgi:biopolymer transport protein ExbB